MNNEKNQTWLPVALIAGALLGWMAILAAGAYWAPVGEREGGDFRKLWVVAATTGGFLLLWGFVLAVRQAKVRRGLVQRAQMPRDTEPEQAGPAKDDDSDDRRV